MKDIRRVVMILVVITAAAKANAADHAAGHRPNILWLIAEDMGPDAVECFDHAPEVHTPVLNAMAAQGVRYTHAYTTAPVCSASRSAFMTGMYQTTIGAQNHRSHRTDGYKVPEGVKPLTDWMRDAGYFTGNLVKLPAAFGFEGTGKSDWNFTYSKPFQTNQWDDLKTHQPFYAQINFHETHRPYKSPKKADPAKVVFPPYYPDHPVTRKDWAQYLDSGMELDHKIGLILRQLEADGMADDTIIFVFGDHGESHVRGKQFCYEEGLHIPLIIRWAKNFPMPSQMKPGMEDARLIEAIDFAPTMLDAAGFAKPAKMQGQIFLGEHAASDHKYIFGARDRCDETVFRFRTVRDDRYRYIRNFTPDRPFLQSNSYKEKSYPVWNLLKELNAEGKLTPEQKVLTAPTMPPEELYDLQSDPYEIHNLAASANPEQQEVRKRLSGVLEKWIADTDDQGRIFEPQEEIEKLKKAAAGTGDDAKKTKKAKKKPE